MGCDIHEYIEIKIGDVWVYVGHIIIHRNYTLFGVLAGVRDETVECVSGEHKGLPDDLSEGMISVMDGENDMDGDWHGDYHTHSYLDLQELVVAKKIYEDSIKDKTEKFPINLKSLKKLKDMPFVEDVRFVFWFDN